jgi:hypothetical protein
MADPQQTEGPSSPCLGTVPLGLAFREGACRHRFVGLDSRVVNWFLMALSAFLGKESPEAGEVVLRLARHWGLVPTVQVYADTHLGRDDHGFAGTPEKDGRPGTDLGHDHFDLGPETEIAAFLPEKRWPNEWATIDASSATVDHDE